MIITENAVQVTTLTRFVGLPLNVTGCDKMHSEGVMIPFHHAVPMPASLRLAAAIGLLAGSLLFLAVAAGACGRQRSDVVPTPTRTPRPLATREVPGTPIVPALPAHARQLLCRLRQTSLPNLHRTHLPHRRPPRRPQPSSLPLRPSPPSCHTAAQHRPPRPRHRRRPSRRQRGGSWDMEAGFYWLAQPV